jgi:hypothetical protein
MRSNRGGAVEFPHGGYARLLQCQAAFEVLLYFESALWFA